MTSCSLAGIALTMIIASGLSNVQTVNRILSACGRESIFILLFHFPLQSASTFVWAHVLPSDPWTVATLSWLSSVSLSVALARVMRMNPWSASLWLPMAQVQRADRSRLAAPLAAGSMAIRPTTRPATARLDQLDHDLAPTSSFVKP
jgi:hypothetical protein